MTYPTPIDALITAISDFETSIEIRDRLTRAELKPFDGIFVKQVKGLAKLSVEGRIDQQLQALKRLTKARAHVKKYAPNIVEDVSGVIGRLLEIMSGEKAVVSSTLSLHVGDY